PGIEADTHEKIRTGHHGSKFGMTPEQALEALRRDPGIVGLHVHIGSQLRDLGAARSTVEWIASFAARARQEPGWQVRTLDLGGGLGVPATPDEPGISIEEFTAGLLAELDRAAAQEGLTRPAVILEPGRSLIARAGVTLYTVGAVKTSGDSTAYVAIDGGMS